MSFYQSMRLKEAGVSLIDCVHKTPAAQVDGYPYIAIPQMKSGHIDFSDARRISSEDFRDWTRKANPKPHDVILSRRTNPGVIAIDRTNTEFALGQNLVILRADGSKVAPQFLRWLCLSPYWWDEIEKYINVGAIFSSLRCADVPNFELPIPPLEVQQDIAGILGALDDKIEVNRKAAATLEAMARALYRSWFVDFDPVHAKAEGRQPAHMDAATAALFPDRFGDNGLPLGWKTFSLDDVCSLKNGYAFKSADWTKEGTPVIKIGSVKPAVIDLNEVSFVDADLASSKQAYIAPVGAAAIGLTGYVGEVGRVPPTDNPPLVNQRVARVDPKNGNAFSPFLYTLMRAAEFKEYVIGKSYGSAQANVSTKDIVTYNFVASESALELFDERLAPLFEYQLSLLGESSTLASLRDTLLPRLMSGELRVAAAEKIVSEAL